MSPPLTTRKPFYSMALAEAHAEAFNHTFLPGYSWLAERLRESGPAPRLFDLGCGDGQFLDEMGKLGIPGEGADISAACVALAHQRGVAARQESAAQAVAPAGTTAVTALGEVLAYEPNALAAAVHMAARLLPSHGVLIFDLPGPDTPPGETAAEGETWSLTARSTVTGRKLTREIIMQAGRQKVRETHEQYLFAPDEVAGILAGLGLEAGVLDSYGPCPLLPGRFALFARKP